MALPKAATLVSSAAETALMSKAEHAAPPPHWHHMRCSAGTAAAPGCLHSWSRCCFQQVWERAEQEDKHLPHMRFTEAKTPRTEPGPGLNSLLSAKASSFQQQGRTHSTGAARAEVDATGGRRGGREARPANTTLSGSCRPSPETRSRQRETAEPDADHRTALPSSQPWVPVAPQPAGTPSPQPPGCTAVLTPSNLPQSRTHPPASGAPQPRASP